MRGFLKILLYCMVFTSFYTHTIDLSSENLIISRMTFSDVFGLLAIVVFVFDRLIKKNYLKGIPKLYVLSFIVVFCFTSTIFTSLNVKATVFEILILGYLISLSLVTYDVFKDNLKDYFVLLVTTSFFMSFIGLFDLFAVNNQLPTFLDYVPMDHAVSGFRYFAQTGNFSFTMLTILIPFRYYESNKLNLSSLQNLFFNATVLLTVLLMIGSGAISIIISFFIAVVLLFFMNFKNKKVLVDITSLVGVIIVFMTSIYFFANDLFKNIVYRIESRVTNRQSGEPESSFIIQNFYDSLKAFDDNWLFGTGLGGFVNNYSEFEIHGTYLKVIGETGVVGVIGYFLFLYCLLRLICRLDINYLKIFIPLFIGNLISWSYNYHFRKKEFWMLFSFLLILNYTFKKIRSKNNG